MVFGREHLKLDGGSTCLSEAYYSYYCKGKWCLQHEIKQVYLSSMHGFMLNSYC